MDDEPDIVTSNRQSVQEDDERYVLLKEFLWEALKKIQADWAAMRENVSTKRATEYPVIKEWYSTLQGDSKTTAQKMFRKIESLPFPDESSKVEMYKATILAHERLAMSSALSILDNLDTPEQFETIAALFRDIDDIEAAHYLEIVRGRLEVVKKFDNILPDSKEKILQEYLFDHLWLLDPSWERAATDPRIEQRVANEIEAIEARLTNGERRGRIDIRYRTAAGKHIIIELKKYNRTVTVPELIDQIGKYKTGLEKVLSTHHPEEKNLIEIIIILGDHPRSDGANAERVLAEYSARYILYDALIQDTLESYNDYLEKQREVNELASLLDRLTNELLE
jgi:hypothetical protein